MTPARPRSVIIGDVVTSRRAADRQALHDAVVGALDLVNATIEAPDPLRITVGDEFQGGYDTLGDALRSRILVRLALAPEIEVRVGLGRGEVTVLDRSTGTQDGPGWWAAREAIDHVKTQAAQVGWERTRTAYRSADPTETTVDAVNAALVCQDLVLGSLDRTEWTIVRGLMQDRTQQQVADELGITRQAVHQRRKSGALPMLLESLARLERLP